MSEPNAFRRSVAELLGLRAIDPAVADVTAEVESWTDGAGADVAFEVSGSTAGLRSATHSLACAGGWCRSRSTAEPAPVDLFRVFWRELEIVGARVYERRDFERAVELLATGAIPAAQLISRSSRSSARLTRSTRLEGSAPW